MYDLDLEWTGDLSAGNDGDLALVSASGLTKQRVLRRLLTNSGGYIWNLNYGGGLAQFIGSPTSPTNIEAVVRAQLALEAALPLSPAPTINIQSMSNGTGYVVANITYADPSSGNLVSLNIPVN